MSSTDNNMGIVTETRGIERTGTVTAILFTVCPNCGEPIADMDNLQKLRQDDPVAHCCPIKPASDLEIRGMHLDTRNKLTDLIRAGKVEFAVAPATYRGCLCDRCESRRRFHTAPDAHERITAKTLPIVPIDEDGEDTERRLQVVR